MGGPHHDINHDMCVRVCESVWLSSSSMEEKLNTGSTDVSETFTAVPGALNNASCQHCVMGCRNIWNCLLICIYVKLQACILSHIHSKFITASTILWLNKRATHQVFGGSHPLQPIQRQKICGVLVHELGGLFQSPLLVHDGFVPHL